MPSPPSHQHKFRQRYKIYYNIKKLFWLGWSVVGSIGRFFRKKMLFFIKLCVPLPVIF